VGRTWLRGGIVISVALGLYGLVTASSAAPPWLVPTPIGAGPKFHPPALNTRVTHRRSVGSLRCDRSDTGRFGVHLELFARGRVVVVPAGIAVAPPWRSVRPHVLEGACSYAARTRTSIGVIEVASGSRITLGEFFDLWGQPLAPRRLVGFRTMPRQPVRAYVDGVKWRGALRSIRLRRHSAIALELGRYVPPHPSFRFEVGL
jgi:hypothetical protein